MNFTYKNTFIYSFMECIDKNTFLDRAKSLGIQIGPVLLITFKQILILSTDIGITADISCILNIFICTHSPVSYKE